MISIFSFILTGVFVGYVTRKSTHIKYVSSVISVIIVLLLFFLGVSVGANKEIVNSFANIGVDAFAIATACTIGSLLCAWFVYNRFFKNKNTNS